ncbi:hypothetical protein T265_16379, partial [Opisthorchis viverrini]
CRRRSVDSSLVSAARVKVRRRLLSRKLQRLPVPTRLWMRMCDCL